MLRCGIAGLAHVSDEIAGLYLLIDFDRNLGEMAVKAPEPLVMTDKYVGTQASPGASGADADCCYFPVRSGIDRGVFQRAFNIHALMAAAPSLVFTIPEAKYNIGIIFDGAEKADGFGFVFRTTGKKRCVGDGKE